MTTPTWQTRAACAGTVTHPDDDVWFPDIGTLATYRAAKAICATCPTRQECLAEALTRNEPAGVWGGMDPDERARLSKYKPGKGKRTPDDIDQLRQRRHDNGWTDRELAEAEQVSRYVIGNWRHRRGLPVNPCRLKGTPA